MLRVDNGARMSVDVMCTQKAGALSPGLDQPRTPRHAMLKYHPRCRHRSALLPREQLHNRTFQDINVGGRLHHTEQIYSQNSLNSCRRGRSKRSFIEVVRLMNMIHVQGPSLGVAELTRLSRLSA